MRTIFTILLLIMFSSCSIKYKGLHTDYKKFNKDIDYCLKKSCKSKTKNFLYNFSIISSAFAYGGGGESSYNSLIEDRISYKAFNLCLKEKGYTKDENGMFEMPNLTCG